MSSPQPPNREMSLWYLLRFLKPYFWLVLWTAVFLVAGQVAMALDPIWLKKIIDGVGAGKGFAALSGIVLTYFILRFVSALFDYLRDLVFAPAEMGIARTMSDRLFSHLLSLPIGFHVEQKIGGIARKITRGGRAVSFILDFLVINILPTLIDLLVVTGFLLYLYPPLYGITTFCTIVFYTWFTLWATEKRQKYRLAANMADDEVSSLEVDALGNIETIKYFNNEGLLHERYLPAINKRYDLSVSSNQLFALISGGQAFILLAGLGIILYMAIRQALAGQLTVGDLVLLTTYLTRLSAPIGVLGFIYRQIKDGLADLDGMAQILQEELTVAEPATAVTPKVSKGEVSFENVSFAYANGRKIFDDLSLAVKPGEKIAFVGPSGVGKSTIVKLLFRFFDPSGGRILIDGTDLRKLNKKTRQSLFAIVPQEPALFNTSIIENIRFGRPGASMEEVVEAAKQASAHAFIESLPEGYETVVGERGVKLSGGEKQRVAIARAIIRQPKILVFDEATSSLDSKSEQAILAALESAAKGRTTIAVAHRLSTIARSDRIFVLNKGGIAESGTHAQLLAKKGLYAQLWKIQVEEKHRHEAEEFSEAD